MSKNLFAVLILGILLLGYVHVVYAQPDVNGRCVPMSEARRQGIQGTDCELFAAGFCPDTKTNEEQYAECYGTPAPEPSPTPEPTPEPGPVPINDTTVVIPPGLYYNTYDVALREYEHVWDNGTKKESDPDMEAVVEEYNTAGGCPGNSPTADPWSAAFISYVMAASGIPFPASCAHINYFRDIHDDPGVCKTFPMTDKDDIQPGDILCQCRPAQGETSCYIDYDDLPADFAPAHCDIVTRKTGDSVEAIGGNVGDSVKKTTRDLNDPNMFGFISCGGMGKPLPRIAPSVEPPIPRSIPRPSSVSAVCPTSLILLFVSVYTSFNINRKRD